MPFFNAENVKNSRSGIAAPYIFVALTCDHNFLTEKRDRWSLLRGISENSKEGPCMWNINVSLKTKNLPNSALNSAKHCRKGPLPDSADFVSISIKCLAFTEKCIRNIHEGIRGVVSLFLPSVYVFSSNSDRNRILFTRTVAAAAHGILKLQASHPWSPF